MLTSPASATPASASFGEVRLDFPLFPSHAPYGKGWKKIGGQFVFSGDPRARSRMVAWMKQYLHDSISARYRTDLLAADMAGRLVSIRCILKLPYNYGTGVKMTASGLAVHPVPEGHLPCWDVGNLGWIWCKCFDDVLVSLGILPEDNVSVVIETGGARYEREDDYEKRMLSFVIKDEGKRTETGVVQRNANPKKKNTCRIKKKGPVKKAKAFFLGKK